MAICFSEATIWKKGRHGEDAPGCFLGQLHQISYSWIHHRSTYVSFDCEERSSCSFKSVTWPTALHVLLTWQSLIWSDIVLTILLSELKSVTVVAKFSSGSEAISLISLMSTLPIPTATTRVLSAFRSRDGIVTLSCEAPENENTLK